MEYYTHVFYSSERSCFIYQRLSYELSNSSKTRLQMLCRNEHVEGMIMRSTPDLLIIADKHEMVIYKIHPKDESSLCELLGEPTGRFF